MTRAELLALVRRQTLVVSGELSDTTIEGDLLQAIHDMSGRYRWPFLKAEATISLVDGTSDYSLPSDLMYLDTLIYDGEGTAPLERTTPEAVKALYGDDVGDADLPHLWYEVDHDTIRFVPTPDAAQDVNVIYYTVFDDTDFDDDAESPPFPAAYHEMVADFAIARFWEREEQEDKASYYWSRYFNGIERLATYYSSRLPAEPLVVGIGSTRYQHRRVPAWWTE